MKFKSNWVSPKNGDVIVATATTAGTVCLLLTRFIASVCRRDLNFILYICLFIYGGSVSLCSLAGLDSPASASWSALAWHAWLDTL